MLEKYHRMPHEWDKSHPPELLPKELRDIEHKELLEAKMYQEAEEKQNEEKPDTTSATRPAKYVNIIPDNPNPNPNQPLKEKPEDNIPNIDINKRDESGNLKPITTMDELAVLMGTDPQVLKQTKEKNADT